MFDCRIEQSKLKIGAAVSHYISDLWVRVT